MHAKVVDILADHVCGCRDCANGFLIAELLSRYFPKDINMRTYENGLSSHFRNDNWMQIQDACRKHGFQLPGELVSGVMREQHGSAVQLLELLYEHLTGKKLLRAGDVCPHSLLLPV